MLPAQLRSFSSDALLADGLVLSMTRAEAGALEVRVLIQHLHSGFDLLSDLLGEEQTYNLVIEGHDLSFHLAGFEASQEKGEGVLVGRAEAASVVLSEAAMTDLEREIP